MIVRGLKNDKKYDLIDTGDYYDDDDDEEEC